MTVAEQDLQQRYGRRPRRLTTVQRTVAITVALLLGTLASYIVFRNSQPDVEGTADSWVASSSRQETVKWQVHKPASATVSCIVRARGADGAEVGRTRVVVREHGSVVHVTTVLPTTALAITGEVHDCVKGAGAS